MAEICLMNFDEELRLLESDLLEVRREETQYNKEYHECEAPKILQEKQIPLENLVIIQTFVKRLLSNGSGTPHNFINDISTFFSEKFLIEFYLKRGYEIQSSMMAMNQNLKETKYIMYNCRI